MFESGCVLTFRLLMLCFLVLFVAALALYALGALTVARLVDYLAGEVEFLE